MKFWDSSAVVPLVCSEKTTPSMIALYQADPDVLVWALSRTEVLSALCRHLRDGSLSRRSFTATKEKLQALDDDWTEIIDYDRVRSRAERLLELHGLSAGDALQLAAALTAVEEKTSGFGFVTLDERLAEAASKEGFSVLGVEA
jgi:predicted nucleic acid-binding protein